MSASNSLAGVGGQRDALIALARAGNPSAETQLDALARQDALERLGDLGIHRGQDAVEEFHHRHLCTEPPPHAAEFETDIAAADHHQVARHSVELEAAGGGDDLLLVHLDAGQRHALGAGGDDDVLRSVGGAVDVHGTRCGDATGALQPGHLVLAEQEFHAFDVGGDDLGLACLHARQIELHAVHQHTVVLQRVRCVVELLG